MAERDFYPRFIVRPPKPAPPWAVNEDGQATERPNVYDPTGQLRREYDKARWDWQHGWALIYDWSVSDHLKKGWECRKIEVGELIEPSRDHDEMEDHHRAKRERIEKLVDKFFANGGSFVEQVTLETREEALRVAAARLREVAADGFLTELLVRGATAENQGRSAP